MSNLTDQAEWGPIYQRKPTDPLDAGPNGLDNLPNQQLANRTAYLRLQGVAPWQSTFTYPAQAMTKVGNALYVALRANLNKNPTALGADWVKFKPDMADLSAATTAARGIIQLATAAEVTAGTVNNKAVAPDTLKVELDKKLNATALINATTTASGIIQLATTAEVTAGTVNNKAVAPNTLKTELDKKLNATALVNATTAARGIIQLATAAEVTAGTVNNKAVAPNTLKAELDKKLNLLDQRINTLSEYAKNALPKTGGNVSGTTTFEQLVAKNTTLQGNLFMQQEWGAFIIDTPSIDAAVVGGRIQWSNQNGTAMLIQGRKDGQNDGRHLITYPKKTGTVLLHNDCAVAYATNSRTIPAAAYLTNLLANRCTALETKAFGIGQIRQNVLPNRQVGIVYTNNTGRPIMVSVSFSGQNSNWFEAIVNGIQIATTGNSVRGNYDFTVLAGETYRINGVIHTWVEVR